MMSCNQSEDFLEKNEKEVSDELIENTKISYPDIKEIPNIHSKLIQIQTKNSTEEVTIGYYDVVEVIDKDGKTNYTFPIYIKGQSPKIIYNLIVHKTATGEIMEPYIKEYHFLDEAYDLYKRNNHNFKYFNGIIKNYKLSDIPNLVIGKANKNSVSGCEIATIGGGGYYNPFLIDENDEITWNNSGNIGYTRPLGAWNDYGGTGGYDLYVERYEQTTGRSEVESVNQLNSGFIEINAGNMVVETSIGSNVSYIRINTTTNNSGRSCSQIVIEAVVDRVSTWRIMGCGIQHQKFQNSSKNETSCPSDDGEVAAIDSNQRLYLIQSFNFAKGSLENQWLFEKLENKPTASQVEKLYSYLIENSSDQRKGFALEAFYTFMMMGEVDFDNEIIIDNTFKNTKANCVLLELINGDNNLFKETLNAFTSGNSQFCIRFSAKDDSGDNAIARTGLPNSNGVITITFNLDQSRNMNSIDLASKILHEAIHAELHRIKLTNNESPNQLPDYLYNWYVDMWEMFENTEDTELEVATAAEHNYMAYKYITPLAEGIREFDEFSFPVENYKRFAWDGLEYQGEQNGYITTEELSDLAFLANLVLTDEHENKCD